MTFTSTSPAPGCVTGRSSGTSISGPPGARMAITVMLLGMAAMVPCTPSLRAPAPTTAPTSMLASRNNNETKDLDPHACRRHDARAYRDAQRQPAEDRAVRAQLLIRPGRDHGAGAVVGELGGQSQARPHGGRDRPRLHAADRTLEGLWRRH